MKQQKFAKEELENSKRIYKSVTPKYTLDWYVKWIASVFLLSAMSLRGIEGFQLIDLSLSLAGIIGWLWVSILWKDRALVILNAAGLVLLLRNLITNLVA